MYTKDSHMEYPGPWGADLVHTWAWQGSTGDQVACPSKDLR